MHEPRATAFLLAAVLGLALAPGAGAAQQAGSEPFEPIRFGDPDELSYTLDFFPGTSYDRSIPSPDELLGQRHGSRIAHHAEILACFRRWAELSPRVRLETYAQTYEGRELVWCAIASPENQARLDLLRAGLARLADPRALSDADAEALLRTTPAVAWLGYSIHGDELSGADAALAVGYHLIAGTSPQVTGLLDELVVVIDPVMNPDGRERIVGLIEQSFGYVTNQDYASMQRGRWPFGRGNHYLFDLNRDWMAGVHPETRGRWAAAASFHPQLFVDAHEMGGLDTFLFYPQGDPRNPHLPATQTAWHAVFAADDARAFDAWGWSYYTREWSDGWYPGYSDAWGALNGAVGILYEQASTDGQPLKRESGAVITYRESVHHHAVSSLANLGTLRANREAILRDYLAHHRRALADLEPWSQKSFVLVPGRNADREEALLRALLAQGVEVARAGDDFDAADVESTLRVREAQRRFPRGALIVDARQPKGALVRAYLELDPRMNDEFLLAERRELERKGASKVYDVTAWCLAQTLDVDGYWCRTPTVEREPLLVLDPRHSGVVAPPASGAPTAWIVDGRDDASVVFAEAALELGLAVHLADERFTSAGRSFARGSLVVRGHENDGDADERVARAAARAGVQAFATATGRSPDDGPDLGGGHFDLLARPRIALVSNEPVDSEPFGHLWHLLDARARAPLTILDAQRLGAYDLRRYNVLVLPSGAGGVAREHAKALASWVRGGGTLVACGSSAAALACAELELSGVRRRRDVLAELDKWLFAAERERAARDVAIDARIVWADAPPPAVEPTKGEDDEDEDEDDKVPGRDPDAARQDEWMRRFAPKGAMLRGLADQDSWITVGVEPVLPVPFSGSHALLAREPVRTAIRLAPPDELRLGGLLWPEARERLGSSAYLTVERAGDGQVILFAESPAFRGYCQATARLFLNAVVYGPGVGARQPSAW